jgi:hypothetical protein
MEFNQTTTIGIFLAIVLASVGALVAAPMMQTSTVLMMVAPSVLVFGGICVLLGIKHGEHRARGI